MFAPRMSWTSLATVCRSLATMLHSGVSLLKALQVVERQQRDGRARDVLRQISDDIRRGIDLASALREHGGYFPELVIDMVNVAEHTGALPEVLFGLADHYENLVRLRNTFLGAIAWPILQLVAAIFIVAGLIWILGILPTAGPGQPSFDPLGFGLRGTSGALTWLGYCFGTAATGFIVYKLLVTGLKQGRAVHGLLLKLPVIGYCLQSFAVARFSWAYALTQQAGMDVQPSIEASLKATNNSAFAAAAPQVIAALMAGEDFTDAISSIDLFPRQFLEMVRVGENSGTVPEALQRMSPQFEEQARRSLAMLTMALGGLIWAMVAAMIIFLIFRLAGFYVGMLNDAASQTF